MTYIMQMYSSIRYFTTLYTVKIPFIDVCVYKDFSVLAYVQLCASECMRMCMCMCVCYQVLF